MRQRHRGAFWPFAVVLSLLVGVSAPAVAESEQDDSQYQRALEQGRSAYNEGDYEKAAEHFADAIQADPENSQTYRNLARTYFWKKDYAHAVVYYDHYLQLASTSGGADKIKRERKLAAQRAGDDVWTIPDSQQRVLGALRDELTDGTAYTKGGGGAWALYNTLLRTGYAHPDLARLKERLRTKLIDEFEGILVVETDQPVPVLSLDQWERQQRRLEAARSLTTDPAVRKIVDRRMKLVETALALLNGRYGDAAELADKARKVNPDMPFVRWHQLSALIHAEKYDKAEATIEQFRKRLGDDSDQKLKYLRVLEAVIAQRKGNSEAAAKHYMDVLR